MKAPAQTSAAWATHAFTACGAVLAFLALDAAFRDDPAAALLWLFAALVVDGVDGTLARLARVKERLPNVDGDALDLVIDYLTYVVVPAALIARGDFLPAPLATPLAALILVSSLYVFARRDMKTDDGYFRGFPALWNVVAFYFVATQPPPPVAAFAVIALVIATFAPVHVPHPFRAARHRSLLALAAVVWTLTGTLLLLPGWSEPVRLALLALSLAAFAAIVGLGLARTVRGPR
jgi:phosphatidylcholine synthase